MKVLPVKIEPEKTHLLFEQALPSPLTACYWEPKDRFILVGTEEFGIRRFHLDSKESVPMVGPHDSWVRAIGTSPDGETTYTGGYDGRLVWWPTAAEKPEPIRVADDAHQGWIRALAVSPDGAHIASCGNDHLVRLWDSQSGELLRTFSGHSSHVYNVAFTPDGQALVSCDLHGHVNLWQTGSADTAAETPAVAVADAADADAPAPAEAAAEAASDAPPEAAADATPETPPVAGLLRELPRLEALHKYDNTFRADIGGARCITFAQTGNRLAIGGVTNVTNAFAGVGDAVVILVDWADAKVVAQLQPKEKVRGTTWGVAHHPDGFWIGLSGGGGGGWLYFWRADETEEFFKLKLKTDARGMCLSPDATRVAVAHADKNLRVYGLHEAAAGT
ncbi:MAG: hypothetical protein EA381_18820 [Planctomycetaceae bacterium]|nr:MAG: hypothetical protein EA381_18820 [Planctomycetaceae bacterium]